VAYSYVTYTADGSTSNFAVPFPYVVKQDIHVSINEIQVDDATVTWVGDTIVHLATTPGVDAVVKVWRSTNKEGLSTIYSTPNVIDHRDWNRVLTQLLYVSQEAYDLGITPFNEMQEVLGNLQGLVNQAQASSDTALLYQIGAEAAKTAAEAARDLAQTYADLASEIAGFDPALYLTKAGNFSGIADPAAARTAIGALGTGDIPANLLSYDVQVLTGPQKAQALANLGAFSSAGGAVSGNTSVAGSLTVTGSTQLYVYGYGGNNAQARIAFQADASRSLNYGIGGDYYNFVGAHVYSAAGRLLGTNDASSIVASLRWVYAGSDTSGGIGDPVTVAGNAFMYQWGQESGYWYGYFRYLQMQIAGTWYTVGAAS
jgi:hypothetical protein